MTRCDLKGRKHGEQKIVMALNSIFHIDKMSKVGGARQHISMKDRYLCENISYHNKIYGGAKTELTRIMCETIHC